MANLFNMQYGKVQAFVGELAEAGLDPDMVEEVLKGRISATAMIQALKAELAKGDEPNVTTYPNVPVDYSLRPSDDFSKSFDLVSEGYAEGNDWQRDERCTNVQTEGRVQLTFELVHFNKIMTTKEVLEALDAMNLRPATLEELVSFSKAHPKLQREFYIVGLGSACRWRGPPRSVPA